eukprot:scaffold657_cov561-Prasinococcus_capsulatus_cf.AAC.8
MGTVSVEGQQLEAPLRYLVVDANAIIRGVERGQLHTLEVKEEIRDERSRQALQQLPFGIECKQPSDSSLRKVSYFARATGDLHALSEVDIKVRSATDDAPCPISSLRPCRARPEGAAQYSRSNSYQGPPGRAPLSAR